MARKTKALMRQRALRRAAPVVGLSLLALGVVIAYLYGGGPYRVGTPVCCRNLAVYPVYGGRARHAADYATLDQAMAAGGAGAWEPRADSGDSFYDTPEHHHEHMRDTARELGQELRGRELLRLATAVARGDALSRSTLQSILARKAAVTVRSASEQALYVPAGHCLFGGRQDRVVSVGTIVPPGAVKQVSVLCAERGRSEGASDLFRCSSGIAHPRLRHIVQEVGKAWDVQEKAWDEVRATIPACDVTKPQWGRLPACDGTKL
jgi:hypothetical protein